MNKTSGWRHFLKSALGPLLIVIAIATIESLGHVGISVPPVAPLFLLMVLSGFYGGMVSTLVASLFVLAYFVHLATNPISPFFVAHDTGIRLLIWSITIPLTGVLIGILKKKATAPLRKELKAREESEIALRQNEERLRQIFTHAHDALIVIDSESHIVEWNPQAEATFGWKREEVLGLDLASTIIPERYRAAHTQGLAYFKKTGEGAVLNKRFEIGALTRNGREIPVELMIYPFKQNDKLYFGSFLHDITDKRMVEQTIQTQLKITRVVSEAETVSEAVLPLLEEIAKGVDFKLSELWLLNRDNKLTLRGTWSMETNAFKKFQEHSYQISLNADDEFAIKRLQDKECDWVVDVAMMSIYERKELAQEMGLHTCVSIKIHDRGQTYGVLNVYHTAILPEDKRILQILTEAGRKISLFIRRRTMDEELAALNRDLEEKVASRTKDLETANENLQKEIKEKAVLYDQAQTANRLKDEFIATVSHELRTPLNVIIGYSEMMINEKISDEERRYYVEVIHRNAKIQSQIVNDILDISRVVTGKMKLNIEDVDINKVIEAAVESVAYSAQTKSIEISLQLDHMASTIAGDFSRLQQVVWNLLSNSIKFTPRYGHIEISTSVIESQVRIQVKDDGQGIEKSFLPYVFERFRQEDASTTRKHGGLGLGLSICRNIIEQHAGSIEALSDGKDKGSTFVITLPIYALKIAEHLPTMEGTNKKSLPLRGLRILVVEDQVDALNLLAKVLSRAGAEVFTATSSPEGLKKVIANKPDLLVSDIGMPDYDGYYLIQMVRKLGPQHGGSIPAIALTAYARPEDQERALKEGFQIHIAKPVESTELVNAVKNLAAKSANTPRHLDSPRPENT